jgi:hypothetical protein
MNHIHDQQTSIEVFTYSQIADAIVAVLKRPEFMDSNNATRATCVRVFEAFVNALPVRCVNCGAPIDLMPNARPM